MDSKARVSRVELCDALEAESKTVFTLFACFVGVFSVAVAVAVYRQPLQLWDESRNLFNALNLAATKSWLVTTYNGVPDHWYTKPPLFVWVVTSLIRVGVSPMTALRVPSLLAALLTIVLLYAFCAFALRRPLAGVLSALLLMCSTLYFGPHIVLAGDIDASLAFFLTACALAFWAYVEDIRNAGTLWLTLSCCALAAAVLTKGIAGALFLPGMLCFALLRPQRWRVLMNWKVWVGVGLVVLLTTAYYLRRNSLDPGYAHAVFVNEFSRYNVVVESHKGGALFYLRLLVQGFEPGAILILLGGFALRRAVSKDELSRSALMLSGAVTLSFLLILTRSKTKTFWYCAPALPLLALFGALGLADTFAFALSRLRVAQPKRLAMIFRLGAPIFLMLVAATGLLARMRHMAAHTRDSDPVLWSKELGKLTEQAPEAQHVVLLAVTETDESTGGRYFPVGQYWAETSAKKQHIDVDFADAAADVPAGSWVISCEPKLYQTLEERHVVGRVIDSSGHCVVEQTRGKTDELSQR